jgi:ribosomal-protein-alanine N-acetyltransferase
MTASEYTVEKAKYSDISSVMEINLRTLPENYPRYFFEHLLDRYPETFLVARMNNQVVGYIMCRIEDAIIFSIPLRKVKRGHVVSFAVLPGYRNMGIGTALLIKALDAMKNIYNCYDAFLEVRVTNHAAISLYKKHGFDIATIKKRYYKDGEDAYVMVKRL